MPTQTDLGNLIPTLNALQREINSDITKTAKVKSLIDSVLVIVYGVEEMRAQANARNPSPVSLEPLRTAARLLNEMKALISPRGTLSFDVLTEDHKSQLRATFQKVLGLVVGR